MKQMILIAEFFQIDPRWHNEPNDQPQLWKPHGGKEEHLNEEGK